MDPGNPFHIPSLTGTIDDIGQDNIFDITVPADQISRTPSGSSTVQRSIGESVVSNRFRPLLRPQKRTSSTSQRRTRSLKSRSDATKDAKHRSKTSFPLSEEQMKEAYCQLEINYRFKPHPTKAQMHALACVVELTYDQVRAFYEQKHSQPPLYVTNGSKLEQELRASNPAKRHRGSDSSSSPEPVDSAYGTYQSDSSASFQTSERSAIPKAFPLSHQIRELSGKPYECTWRGQACQKSFGSKSDWKRHEEVHCPQWYWLCPLESGPEGNSSNAMPCNRKFKRDDHLREHLKKDHKCADLSKIEEGRQPLISQSPFNRQCGFCGQITRDWLDRIDHIAEHFKNGKRMSEWRDPWPEDIFEEGSDPSDNDDDEGDKDDKDNNNSTSDKQGDPRADSGKDNRKNGNTDSQNRGYQSFGNGYVRPGSFGIRYHASNRPSDITEGPKRPDDAFLIDDADSLSSFWSKMRNMLKNMKRQKGTDLASLDATKAASVSACLDADQQGEERIDFYCILCLKLVFMDPSLQNTDDSYCTCSEAAIKDHISSLTNPHPGLPLPEKSEDGKSSKQLVQKRELGPDITRESFNRDKVIKHHLPPALDGLRPDENELQHLAKPKKARKELCQRRPAAMIAQDESLAHSMRRYLKLNSPPDDSSEGREILRRTTASPISPA
jgi:hypothetical protein